MRRIDRRPDPEIAAMPGVGVCAVKMHHLRAFQEFRAQIADHSGEDAT
jgi:hypothetical protein